ncbi:hypothetical protein KCP71_15325 [Salmonella enterica subsp. enterica]|nr:hypothetical protein KCP71_15325 [Salmonella enterica subsp. enterica]
MCLAAAFTYGLADRNTKRQQRHLPLRCWKVKRWGPSGGVSVVGIVRNAPQS